MNKNYPVRIIVDGVDKCAKTIIAKKLAEVLDIPYFKNKNEAGAFLNMDSEYFVSTLIYAEPFFCDFVNQANISFVQDRGFASEFVYSQVFERQSNVEWIKRVDTMYASLNTFIIIPHRSSYVGRIDEMSHGKIDENKMVLIDEMYREFSRWTQCKNMLLNVDDEDLTREINDILSFISVDIKQSNRHITRNSV